MPKFVGWGPLCCSLFLIVLGCGSTGLAPQPLAVCRFPHETGVAALTEERPDIRFVYELGDPVGSRLAPILAAAFTRMTGTPFLFGAVTAEARLPALFCDMPACPAHAVAVGELARRLDPYPPQGQVVRTRRIAKGSRQLWLVQGEGPLQQAIAAYRFLHALGVRFYHPRAAYFPVRKKLAIPEFVERTETPGYSERGWHLETLAPTPAGRAFLGGGEAPLARAEEIIDWLLANGQTLVQWSLPATWSVEQHAHFRALTDLIHSRGMKAGALLRFGPGDHAAGFTAEARVSAALSLGLDLLALGMETPLLGPVDREHAKDSLARALNHAIATGGAARIYWHAAGDDTGFHYANRQAGVMVAGGYVSDLFTAEGEDELLTNRHFSLLADEAAHRKVAYFSYINVWDDYDINVPVFLPAYWYARWLDLQQLRSIPGVSVHIASDSGWEWAYWSNAAIVFSAAWNPQRDFERTVEDVFAPMGRNTCGQVTATLASLAKAQRELAVGRGLAPFLTGQGYIHEGLARAGFPVRPLRPEYGAVVTNASLATTLETTVIPELERFLTEWTAMERGLFPAIPRVDEPAREFLQEFVDSVVITRLYVRHKISLLRAAVAAQRGDLLQVEEEIRTARDQTSIAGLIVSAREPLYRYPAEEIAGLSPGPEGVPHGYLYSVRNLSLWNRDEALLESSVHRKLKGLLR